MRSGKLVMAEVGGPIAVINRPLARAGASAVASTSLRHSRSWYEIAKPYARASHRRAVTQLLNTGLAVSAPHRGVDLRRQKPFLADPSARATGGISAGPTIHHPARLRPRLLLGLRDANR